MVMSKQDLLFYYLDFFSLPLLLTFLHFLSNLVT
jgi:hypothetical protein